MQKSPLEIGINGDEGAYFGEIKGIFSKIAPFKDVLDLKIIKKGVSNGEKCQNLQKSPLGGVRVNLSKCGVLWRLMILVKSGKRVENVMKCVGF